jgi:hypothetical protein
VTKAKTTTTPITDVSKLSPGIRGSGIKTTKTASAKARKGRKAKKDQNKEPTGRTVDAGGESPEGTAQQLTRSVEGQFLPGISGNPNGRPKGKKNIITVLKQDLEIAIREGLTVSDIQNVVQSMLAEALNGNVGAGKLLLDKVLSNAKEAEDEKESSGGLKIIIENATLDVMQQPTPTIIDVTPEEVSNV